MDDFPGLLAGEFGLKPQGKSAPMASSHSGHNLRSNHNSNTSNSVFDDHDRYSGVFGGPPKLSSASGHSRSLDYDSIFRGPSNSDKSNNYYNDNSRDVKPPVYDKPVYDDDIFDGLPGLKTSSASSVRYDDVFASVSASPPSSRGAQQKNAHFDDLLGSLGKKEPKLGNERGRGEKDSQLFDDLIPGFGGSSTPSSARTPSESSHSHKTSSNSAKMASNIMEDPFVVLESTSTPETASSGMSKDPLEEIIKLSSSGKTKVGSSFVSGGVFDDIGHLDSLGKPVSPILSENNNIGKDKSPSRTGATMSGAQNPANEDPIDRFSPKHSESHPQKKVPVDNFQESHQTLFDMPNVSADFRRPSTFVNASPNETNSQVDMSPQYEENLETSDDEWLTVSDIPLFTQPTSAPPPSRPPPPIPARVSKSRSFASAHSRKKVNEFSSFPKSTQYSHSPRSAHAAAKSPVVSQMDQLEEFAMGRTRNDVNNHADVVSDENVETNSTAASAAAMKDAMDRAEAKFRHAREVRGREYLKAARSRELMQDVQEGEVREKQERLDLDKDRERAHEIEREREEREQRRLEKERERVREIEREREQARKAVERATREARERAAAEAHIKAERAAVEKAKAEARERAERAAVQRAQAEARERAAAEARERAEKVAAEARERANAEARDKEAQEKAAAARVRSQRAAVERAAAEARERAAAARVNQQKNENDLESFFSMGSRPSSAPRPKANSSDPLFDTQFQSKGGPEAGRRTSVGTSSNIRKASSATNIVDDLTSIFGAAPSSGDFQEVEGESEERRKARMERHQRTQERAVKALAEKNERDLQAQRERAERHRMAETLDVEVKRWAAGKERNLRALLSTLQYVLWAECGWQPVSLTDLITGASVKKAYRKATLCIHPDKVQQKGATLQQKYIAEKVFDLLKEAWNKFNSEELF